MSIKINQLEEGHNSYSLVCRRSAETCSKQFHIWLQFWWNHLKIRSRHFSIYLFRDKYFVFSLTTLNVNNMDISRKKNVFWIKLINRFPLMTYTKQINTVKKFTKLKLFRLKLLTLGPIRKMLSPWIPRHRLLQNPLLNLNWPLRLKK